MGACWNSPLPPEGDLKTRLANYGIQPSLPKAMKTPGAGFSKEEAQLRDLLSALRTGLLFSPAQFNVLPGLSTTGRVLFTLGNTELHRLIDEDSDEEGDMPEAIMLDKETEQEETAPSTKEKYPFQITLKGRSWSRNLTMKLILWPTLGPFAGQKVVFVWSEDTLRARGCEGVNARHLPEGFDSEAEFCRYCLFLLHQPSVETKDEVEDIDACSDDDQTVESLKQLAYKTAVCNLDMVEDLYAIPPKLYYDLFGSRPPVVVALRVWPTTMAAKFQANSTLRVKSQMVFAEFMYLLCDHFNLPSTFSLKLYHNFKAIAPTDVITSDHHTLDCFVIDTPSQTQVITGCYDSLDESHESTITLVTSLVGTRMVDIEADMDMTMRELDMLLRKQFSLQQDSFLVIVSEDDYCPQYTADDNWRCTYPFNVPDTSLSAGLRRSFRRLSEKRAGASRLTQSQRFRRSQSEANNTLASHMSAVVKLLSSNNRQFPSTSQRYSLHVKELYQSMPLYQMSTSQCGIHTNSVVQIFEVTGPSIPITVRLMSTYNKPSDQLRHNTTSLANIMDINPAWSVSTFLQYVDTIISPGTSAKRKRLTLNQHCMDETEGAWQVTIGALLDKWGPVWWPLIRDKRTPLAARDIDPAEFLLIEKY